MFDYERHGRGDCMMYGMGGMWLIWIIIVLIIIFGAIMMFRSSSGSRIATGSSNEANNEASKRIPPLDIAKERYAKGEITEEEFDRIISRLKEHD